MAERRWTLPEDRERLTRKQLNALFMRQDGKCGNCGQRLEVKGHRPVCVDEHLEPLWRGGSNELTNRELWCAPCTVPKTAMESTQRGKAYRVRDKHIGTLVEPKGRGFSKRFKKKMDGTVIDTLTGRPVGKR